MSEIDELLRHIDACPLGWNEGKLITTRRTTEADVLAWVQKLKWLRDGMKPCGSCAKPIGKDPQAQSLGFCSGTCARSHDAIWWEEGP